MAAVVEQVQAMEEEGQEGLTLVVMVHQVLLLFGFQLNYYFKFK
jgi:hypothetical protein